MWVPSQHGKWDVVMQWETSIADGVALSIPYMPEGDGRSLWKHPWSHHGPYQAISAKIDSQISYKIQGFRYPLSMGNGMLCCNELHPLLMKWSESFLVCIREKGGAFESIFQPSMDHTVWYIWRFTLKLHRKSQILGTFSALEVGWCATMRGIHCCWNGS